MSPWNLLLTALLQVPIVVLTDGSRTSLAPTKGNVLIQPHPYIPSHHKIFLGLAVKLAAKGYNVTVFRHTTKLQALPKGLHEILGEGYLSTTDVQDFINGHIERILWQVKESYTNYFRFMGTGFFRNVKPCQDFIKDKALQRTLREGNFSMSVIDPTFNICGWVSTNLMKIPYITVIPMISFYYMETAASVPCVMSYVPAALEAIGDRMTFPERIQNLLSHWIFSSSGYWWIALAWAKFRLNINNVYLRPIISITQDDPMYAFPRPYSPSFLAVGHHQFNRVRHPIHDNIIDTVYDNAHASTGERHPANATTADVSLATPMTSLGDGRNTTVTNGRNTTVANDGVVIFSLTTISDKDSLMPPLVRANLLESFNKFPNYQFIWRTAKHPKRDRHSNETALVVHELEGRYGNVHFTDWFNQTNLFGHPQTKLLITHGGLFSIQEAARHGVPVLGIPLGIEQHSNIARTLRNGLGTVLRKYELNVDRITKALETMLKSGGRNRYKRRSVKFQQMLDTRYRSLIADPLLWHVEYAIRQGERLRSFRQPKGERRLGYIDYFHVDIACVFLLVTGLTCWTVSRT